MINLYNFNLGSDDICLILTVEYVKMQPLLLTKLFMKTVGGQLTS